MQSIAQFFGDSPPRVVGYHVVIDGRPVAMVTLDELALAGFSVADEVQTFRLADEVTAGSLLFWHKGDGMLHDHAGAGQGTPIGMTMRDLKVGTAVRLFRDSFIPLDAELKHPKPEDQPNPARAAG